MRLLDTETGRFLETDPKAVTYAILSHTWDPLNGEQTYSQLKQIQDRYPPDLQQTCLNQPFPPPAIPEISDSSLSPTSSVRSHPYILLSLLCLMQMLRLT